MITCWCTVFPNHSRSSVFVRSGDDIIGIVTTVQTRRQRNCVSIPASEKDFGIHRRVHPACCFLGNRSAPFIYGTRGLKMTTQFHLVLRLIMCGDITFIPHYSFVVYIQIFLTLCIYSLCNFTRKWRRDERRRGIR